LKNTLLLSVLFSLFSYSIGSAQSDNKLKILGCWEIRQVIFTKPFEGSDEISSDALTTVVCFDKDGKFSHKNGEVILSKGNYSLSENGRTLSQKPEAGTNLFVKDVPGQIMMLSDTELQIQADEMILYLRKGD